MQDLNINITYKERGYIGTKNVTENKWMFLEFLTDPEKTNSNLKEFKTAFKQAVKVFSSSKVYNVEVRLENDRQAYFLICQDYGDKEAGVYTVYDYTMKNETNILKVSKDALIKRFETVVTQVLQENNII